MKRNNRLNQIFNQGVGQIVTIVWLSVFSTLAYAYSEGEPSSIAMFTKNSSLSFNNNVGVSTDQKLSNQNFLNQKIAQPDELTIIDDFTQKQLLISKAHNTNESWRQPSDINILNEKNNVKIMRADNKNIISGSKLYLALLLFALLALKLELHARSKQ